MLTNMPSACFSIAEKKSWNEKIIGGNSFKEIVNFIEYVRIIHLQEILVPYSFCHQMNSLMPKLLYC